MKRLSVLATAAAMAVAIAAQSHSPARAQAVPTAPPPPPPPNATPTPMLPPGVLPSTPPQNATVTFPQGKSHATPAPPKDPDANRIGISGIWEVALQQTSGVQYTHFKITQSGSILTGTYLDGSNKKFPLSGSIDGKAVRVVVSLPDGSDIVFNGTQDGNTDMVGTMDTAKDTIGFTAEYRPKYKWTDNLNPSPGGMLPGAGGGGANPGTPY